MREKKNHTMAAIVGLFALVALIAGLLVSHGVNGDKRIDTRQFHGTLLDKPRPIQPFALTGIDNAPFSKASLQGHWTMIFFGFTQCGSICPTTMAELGKMYRLLEEKKIKPLPQVVMISVDAERDNLGKLSHYVKAFNPHFYGARGDDNALNKMTKEMGIAYTKVALKGSKSEEDYDIEHTGTVILFNPQGELVAFFTMPHQASLLAKDYQLVVS